MGIEFTCTAGHKLRVPDELAGKPVRCPKCSERLVVPEVGRKPIEPSKSGRQSVEPEKRATSQHKSLKSTAPPLAELTAWRGGLSKPATSAQIAADYSDSVVIVRTENSTGTGFFVAARIVAFRSAAG
jgi:hypothetical protein